MNEMLKYKLDCLEVKLEDYEEYKTTGRSDFQYYGEDVVDEFFTLEVPRMDVVELLEFMMKHVFPMSALPQRQSGQCGPQGRANVLRYFGVPS